MNTNARTGLFLGWGERGRYHIPNMIPVALPPRVAGYGKSTVHTLYSTIHMYLIWLGINSCDYPDHSISNDRSFINTY